MYFNFQLVKISKYFIQGEFMAHNKPHFNFNDKESVGEIAKTVLTKMLENPGMTLKEATGLSDEILEEIYHLAYSFYNQGRYDEGLALFQFLAGTCPKVYKYVLGLAGCHHQKGAYEEAAIGFYIALNIEPLNPIPAYYATDCFLKLKQDEEALEMAEATILICGDHPEYAELSRRCQMIAETVKYKK